MKALYIKLSFLAFLLSIPASINIESKETISNDFQGKATYISKSKMDLGRWGDRLSAAQKKQVAARLKNRLEKTYTLTFNMKESFFKESDKLDAISGATDSWGKYFSPGDQYKNVKTNQQIQSQEFYGKNFLVKDKLQKIEWKLEGVTKKIGNYECYKAIAMIPSDELTWYNFSWSKLRSRENKGSDKEEEVAMTPVEAWYSPNIPVSHGPQEFWGLPGLILEVSYNNTTFLCSELVLNPKEKMKIVAPKKGEEVTKSEYQEIIIKKMKDFRNMRMGRRRSR